MIQFILSMLSYLSTQLVYVMPSTSGRAATYPKRTDKLKFFYELKDLRDKLKAKKEANPVSVAETPNKQDDTPCSPSTAIQHEE